jgi:hypothetical protein
MWQVWGAVYLVIVGATIPNVLIIAVGMVTLLGVVGTGINSR